MATITTTYLDSTDTSTNYSFNSSEISYGSNEPTLNEFGPSGTTFYTSYNTSVDAVSGGGSLSGTAVGSASISSGQLVLNGSTDYVDYAATSNADSVQVGCIRVKVTPGYSGSPSTNSYFWDISASTGSFLNRLGVYHHANGNLYLRANQATGTSVINGAMGLWSATASTEYEVEFNWDFTAGESRVFVDGALIGSRPETLTRDTNIGLFRVGANVSVAEHYNGSIGDIQVFSTVQHTTAYSVTAFSPYATGATLTVANAVITTNLEALTVTSTVPTNTTLQFTVSRDGTELYWSGSEWLTSETTTSRTNYNASITTANWQSLISEGSSGIAFNWFLGSDDGIVAPTLSEFAINYQGTVLASITGTYLNPDGSFPSSATVQAVAKDITLIDNQNIQINPSHVITSTVSGSTGTWTMSLLPHATYEFRFFSGTTEVAKVDKNINTTGSMQFS